MRSMKAALVVSWTGVNAGFEKKLPDYALEVAELWEKYAADGKCSHPEYMLFAGGKSLWMVKGELAMLQQLVAEEPARRLMLKGMWILKDFGYEFAIIESSADESAEIFFAVGGELGLF
jgi:hypothetical protein